MAGLLSPTTEIFQVLGSLPSERTAGRLNRTGRRGEGSAEGGACVVVVVGRVQLRRAERGGRGRSLPSGVRSAQEEERGGTGDGRALALGAEGRHTHWAREACKCGAAVTHMAAVSWKGGVWMHTSRGARKQKRPPREPARAPTPTACLCGVVVVVVVVTASRDPAKMRGARGTWGGGMYTRRGPPEAAVAAAAARGWATPTAAIMSVGQGRADAPCGGGRSPSEGAGRLNCKRPHRARDAGGAVASRERAGRRATGRWTLEWGGKGRC